MSNFTPTEYKLLCVATGEEFEDAGWGTDGAALLRWMVQQPNVELILGNHEAMLLSCSFLFASLSEESAADIDEQKLKRTGEMVQ